MPWSVWQRADSISRPPERPFSGISDTEEDGRDEQQGQDSVRASRLRVQICDHLGLFVQCCMDLDGRRRATTPGNLLQRRIRQMSVARFGRCKAVDCVTAYDFDELGQSETRLVGAEECS